MNIYVPLKIEIVHLSEKDIITSSPTEDFIPFE